MQNTKITDYGNIKILEFNKMLEFENKVKLAVALKTYNNGFSRLKNLDINNNKFENIAKVLNVKPTDILLAKQEHTDNITVITENNSYTLDNTDGIITDNLSSLDGKITDFYDNPSYANMIFNYITVIPYNNSMTSEASV